MPSMIRKHIVEDGLPAQRDFTLNRVLFDPNRKTLSLSLDGENIVYTELSDADWTALMDLVKKYVDPAKDNRVLAAKWETLQEVKDRLAAEKLNQ